MTVRVLRSTREERCEAFGPGYPEPANPLLKMLLAIGGARKLGLTYEEYFDAALRMQMMRYSEAGLTPKEAL